MRVRRKMVDDNLVVETAAMGTDDWSPATDGAAVLAQAFGPSPLRPDYELQQAQADYRRGGNCLPFQPRSFRDFMNYEQHTIDASRGLVRRFHPAQYRATAIFERVTGRPFPLFRPHSLLRDQPGYYLSNHLTFVPSGTPMATPSYSNALDFELEIGFVLAKPLRNASPTEAEDAIGAVVLVNDFSCRDVQRREMASGFGPQKSKHFASSLSSEAVLAGAILDRIDRLTGSVIINGDTVSEVSSAGGRWRPGQLLAHASTDETLEPGELLATGTLPGGSGMEIGRWLKAGDTLTLRLDGVGQVTHDII